VSFGFSVAIHANPDFFLLGEILTIADEAFEQKCFAKLAEFRPDKTIGYVGVRVERYVMVDPKLFRTAAVNALVGDAFKTCTRLGWKPAVSFGEITLMGAATDLERLMRVADPLY
jgi:GDP-D-mannose dehydratase